MQSTSVPGTLLIKLITLSLMDALTVLDLRRITMSSRQMRTSSLHLVNGVVQSLSCTKINGWGYYSHSACQRLECRSVIQFFSQNNS